VNSAGLAVDPVCGYARVDAILTSAAVRRRTALGREARAGRGIIVAMKFVCYREFDDPSEPVHPGIVVGARVLPLARLVAVSESIRPQNLSVPEDIYDLIGLLPTYALVVKELAKLKVLDQLWQEVGVTLAPPIPRPNRLFGIGRNYADHAAEQGSDPPIEEPIVFMKASTSVIGSGQPIVVPEWAERVDFEGELAVVIGLAGKDIEESNARRHIAGYTLVNDVTERNMQTRDMARSYPWFRSKSIDTFCPMGPCIVTADEIRDPQDLRLVTSVNGELKQDANTSQMIHGIPKLISWLSKLFALEAGDVIATGTPAGIGPLKPGDTVTVTVPEIGTLSNPVVGAYGQ
jgi:2-keto-4-pentenoate hydratase/2-oxohepta-3-ene-1,7-dioic acid hydratase in catechol pathway